MRKVMRTTVAVCVLVLLVSVPLAQTPAATQVTAIRAGRLIDPETGTAATNQIILVEGETIKAVGPNVAIPAGATVIDLSKLAVLPGLVESHNHMSLTHTIRIPGSRQKGIPDSLYINYLTTSSELRTVQTISNAIQMLESGFTIVRDMGNSGRYIDTAVREGIEQGWIPGPTMINSGIIIAPMGGQFRPTPEMWRDKDIMYPEYLDADTPDEIVKAVRQNVLFGAKVIKVGVDTKPYMYTVDDLKLLVAEAAKSGLRVEAHQGSVEGARRAIEAGVWSIAHATGLTDANHKLMAQKGIFRCGTETPFNDDIGSKESFARTVASLKNAYENKVPLTFGTDADFWVRGKTRGEVVLDYLMAWKAAAIPVPDILRALTVNGYKVSEVEKVRGLIKPGLAADIIAVPGNPLADIDAVRDVQFVMKDGLVFKRDGVVTPQQFFNGGPVRLGRRGGS